MPLDNFHPVIHRWFSETLGEPTAAQKQGWAAIREERHTLIAAPTGSGKTLAAFLSALNDLFEESLHGPLPDEVRVVYVSPLKALSADIHKNLAEPRKGIRRIADEIHAVIGTRRGAHLAITLERLQRVASAPLHRVGLSATQNPIEEVAKYLAGPSECGG